MKIYKNLFEKIVSIENIFEAWNEFKADKRNRFDVQVFELRLEDNLFQLHYDLADKKYKHGQYIAFYVRDPKLRKIHRAEIRDRVLHRAIFRVLNPIFEKTFIADSYSSRIDKGTHKGIRRFAVFARKIYQTHNRCFVLKCDIKKFFPTIDHAILLEIISRRIKDPDAFSLIRQIIGSFSSEFSKDREIKGAPIGNLTSQLFSNIYMNELDQFIKQKLRIKYYVRYADDFTITHQNEDYLFRVKDQISEFLSSELKLSLHPDKVEIRKYRQGVDFLGYVALPEATILRAKVRRRIFKKLHHLVQRFKQGQIAEEKILRSFDSYLGVLSHADSYKLEQELRQKLWEWLKSWPR